MRCYKKDTYVIVVVSAPCCLHQFPFTQATMTTPVFASTKTEGGIAICLWNVPADPAAQPPKDANQITSACPTSSTPSASVAPTTPASAPVSAATGQGVPLNSAAIQSGTSSTAGRTPSAAPANTGSKGLAGGAVAGIAIGMLLAGALIAGFIFLFLLRRQKRRHTTPIASVSRGHASHPESNMGIEKGPTAIAAPVGNIDDLLPQPAEDDAITSDLSRIRDNINNHVRTYYHSEPITATDVNERGIRDIAAAAGTSAAVVVEALADPTNRNKALRSIIASEILTRCTGERSPSLLPNDVAAMSASIPVSNGNNCRSLPLVQVHHLTTRSSVNPVQ
jgi:hypothetical protein